MGLIEQLNVSRKRVLLLHVFANDVVAQVVKIVKRLAHWACVSRAALVKQLWLLY